MTKIFSAGVAVPGQAKALELNLFTNGMQTELEVGGVRVEYEAFLHAVLAMTEAVAQAFQGAEALGVSKENRN